MKPLFSNLLSDGGPLFMYPLVILLIICIALLIKAFIKGDPDSSTRKLVGSISLFALVWGFLGHLIGLIGALDAISIASDISNGVLAAGLKIALLSPTFGMVVFLIARAGMIGLQLKKK
ncbi:MAG: MotA/TolQ/ExbB proton channel family protein [Flavobacteriaceae bacterium]